ncbi:glycosyltransferase family 2 protein [Hirschia litorea]|uniref:Glycosyltransferase family 2 protein n=1 Tax=Hirschia litorea TaxID=1199156 RepID=A0ABW2IGA5_9PROT
MTFQKDVSVIIAAWRAQDYIQNAIESALSQEGVEIEVIVVDDASPDRTSEVARACGEGDDRLQVIKMPQNGGPSKARNQGISVAQGRYIAVLDADDTFLPGRLALLVKAADDEKADIIVDNIVRVDGQGQSIEAGPFLTQPEFSKRHVISLEHYIRCNMIMSDAPALGYLKPLFSSAFLQAHHLSYDESLRNSEDYYLVADILAKGGKMTFEPIAKYAYRVEAGSISHRLNTQLTERLVDAAVRFDRRHGDAMSAAEKDAARLHRERLENTHVFQQIVEYLKAKRLLGVLAVMAQRPRALSFVFGQFFKIAKEKLHKLK